MFDFLGIGQRKLFSKPPISLRTKTILILYHEISRNDPTLDPKRHLIDPGKNNQNGISKHLFLSSTKQFVSYHIFLENLSLFEIWYIASLACTLSF